VQIPGGLVAAWFSFTDTHTYLEWIVVISVDAALYTLLFTLVVSLYSWSPQTSAGAFRGARRSSLVMWVCGWFLAINLLSSVFLCFNTKRIEFFDSELPHILLVMVVSAFSILVGIAAFWWSYNKNQEAGKRPSTN
jgi:hypothetical protein